MVNIREQVVEKLKTVCPNVKAVNPEGAVTLPLITYAEVTNTKVGMWHERVTMQVDIRAPTFEQCLQLTDEVNTVMEELNFKRTYTSSDSSCREMKGLYHKAVSYICNINTNINTILEVV